MMPIKTTMNQIEHLYMNTSNHLFAWIENDNNDQAKWAIEYLQGKGLLPYWSVIPHPYQLLMANTSNWTLIPEHELLIIKMKRAWTKANSRSKQKGKSSRSYVLHNSTIVALDKLAKAHNLQITHTLEKIILEWHSFHEIVRGESQKEIADLKEAQSQKITALKEAQATKLAYAETKPSRDFNEAKKHIKELNKLLEKELRKQCEYLVILEDRELTELTKEQLTSEQQQRIDDKMKIKDEIRSNLKHSKNIYLKTEEENSTNANS